ENEYQRPQAVDAPRQPCSSGVEIESHESHEREHEHTYRQMYPAYQSFVSLYRLGIHHPQLECRDSRGRNRATGKHQMNPALALFAPNGQIHCRKGQTCSDVYRPGEGDPTHGFETLSALTIRRPPRWFSLIFFGKYGPKFRKSC